MKPFQNIEELKGKEKKWSNLQEKETKKGRKYKARGQMSKQIYLLQSLEIS